MNINKLKLNLVREQGEMVYRNTQLYMQNIVNDGIVLMLAYNEHAQKGWRWV